MSRTDASGKARDISGRPINAPGKLALKQASKQLVRAAGGVEAAALYSRPGKTLLGSYGSPNDDTFMPVDVVVDLEAITRGTANWPIVTRLLATEAGCALVELPPADAVSGNIHADMACIAAESGEITSKLCRALADDHRVSADEIKRDRMLDDVDDLIAAAVNLRARLERIAAGD